MRVKTPFLLNRIIRLTCALVLFAQPALCEELTGSASKEWALSGYAFGYIHGYRDGGQAIATASMQSTMGHTAEVVLSNRERQLDQGFQARALHLNAALVKEGLDEPARRQALLGFAKGYKEAVSTSAEDFSADIAPRINEGLRIKKGALNARCGQRSHDATMQQASRLNLEPRQVKIIVKHASRW